jgi:hypothetical protein
MPYQIIVNHEGYTEVKETGPVGPPGPPGRDGGDSAVTSVDGRLGIVTLSDLYEPFGRVETHESLFDHTLFLTSVGIGDINTHAGSPTNTTFLRGDGVWATPAGGGGGGGITDGVGDVTFSGSGTVITTIENLAITTAKLDDGAVTSPKIVDGAVVTAKLGDLSVTGAKIVDGTISGIKLADGIITSAKIADGTITNVDISAVAAIALSKLNATGTPGPTNFLRGDGVWTTLTGSGDVLSGGQAGGQTIIGSNDATWKQIQNLTLKPNTATPKVISFQWNIPASLIDDNPLTLGDIVRTSGNYFAAEDHGKIITNCRVMTGNTTGDDSIEGAIFVWTGSPTAGKVIMPAAYKPDDELTHTATADLMPQGAVIVDGPFIGGYDSDLLSPKRRITATWAAGGSTLTATGGTIFFQSDVGKSVRDITETFGPFVSQGTRILTVASNGLSCTVSKPMLLSHFVGYSLWIGSWALTPRYRNRATDLFIGHSYNNQVDSPGPDNWPTSPLRIEVNQYWDDNPGFQIQNTAIPGPDGVISITGPIKLGPNLGSKDNMGGAALNTLRSYSNIKGQNAYPGGFLHGIIHSDTFIATGGELGIMQILPITPNFQLKGQGGTAVRPVGWDGNSPWPETGTGKAILGNYYGMSFQDWQVGGWLTGFGGAGSSEIGTYTNYWANPPYWQGDYNRMLLNQAIGFEFGNIAYRRVKIKPSTSNRRLITSVADNGTTVIKSFSAADIGLKLGNWKTETVILTRVTTNGDSSAAGSTFTLRERRETTAPIPATSAGFTATAVKAALEALPSIGTGIITCTQAGGAGTPITVTFGQPSDYDLKKWDILLVENRVNGANITVTRTEASGFAVGVGANFPGHGYITAVGALDANGVTSTAYMSEDYTGATTTAVEAAVEMPIKVPDYKGELPALAGRFAGSISMFATGNHNYESPSGGNTNRVEFGFGMAAHQKPQPFIFADGEYDVMHDINGVMPSFARFYGKIRYKNSASLTESFATFENQAEIMPRGNPAGVFFSLGKQSSFKSDVTYLSNGENILGEIADHLSKVTLDSTGGGSFYDASYQFDVYNFKAEAVVKGAGVTTPDRYGFYYQEDTASGGAHFGNQYGVYVPTLSKANNDYAAFFAGSYFDGVGRLKAASIIGDVVHQRVPYGGGTSHVTNLHGNFETDLDLKALGSIYSANFVYAGTDVSGTSSRLAPGLLSFGPGFEAYDTYLYRSASNAIKTDGSFDITGTAYLRDGIEAPAYVNFYNETFRIHGYAQVGVDSASFIITRKFALYANDTDTAPVVSLDHTGISNPRLRFGSGGSTTPDVILERSADLELKLTGALKMAGLAGATAASRFVGAIASGTTPSSSPSGGWLVGDWVIDIANKTIRVCTTAGSPGVWEIVSTTGGGVTEADFFKIDGTINSVQGTQFAYLYATTNVAQFYFGYNKAAAPIAANGALGWFVFRGQGGSTQSTADMKTGGYFGMIGEETFSSTTAGARWVWATTKLGTSTQYYRMFLDSSGDFGIGGATATTNTAPTTAQFIVRQDGSLEIGTNGSPAFTVSKLGAVVAASLDLTTPLAVADGGTGTSSLTDNRLLVGNGTAAVGVLAAGTAGQVLQSNGASDPSWVDLTDTTYLAYVKATDVNSSAGVTAVDWTLPANTLATNGDSIELEIMLSTVNMSTRSVSVGVSINTPLTPFVQYPANGTVKGTSTIQYVIRVTIQRTSATGGEAVSTVTSSATNSGTLPAVTYISWGSQTNMWSTNRQIQLTLANDSGSAADAIMRSCRIKIVKTAATAD